jgi:hypothetical protein
LRRCLYVAKNGGHSSLREGHQSRTGSARGSTATQVLLNVWKFE